MYSKFALISSLKNSLSWIFFVVLYPYMVMSLIYSGGDSITGLLFSYITILPTLYAVKIVRKLKAKSVNLNEYITEIIKDRVDYANYSLAVKGLKIFRVVALVAISLFFARLLFDLFSISTIISSSLNSFLIALLQLYYMVIVIIRVKYEA